MDLFYREIGEGDPVILMHGLFGSADNLGSFARALSATYRVISVDMRNHGRSPHDTSMRYSDMSEDIIQLLDRLAIDKTRIFGHSMGGKAAMQFALNHGEHVEKLLVADIAPVEYRHKHSDILAGMNRVKEEQPASRKDVIAILKNYESEQAVLSFLATNWRKDEDGQWGWRINLEAIEREYSEIAKGMTGGPYNGPTMFIRGGNSDYLRSEHTAVVKQLFPKATVRTIEGTGHWLHAEKPELFASTALRFYND